MTVDFSKVQDTAGHSVSTQNIMTKADFDMLSSVPVSQDTATDATTNYLVRLSDTSEKLSEIMAVQCPKDRKLFDLFLVEDTI